MRRLGAIENRNEERETRAPREHYEYGRKAGTNTPLIRFSRAAIENNELIPQWTEQYIQMEGNDPNTIKERNKLAAKIRSLSNVRRYLALEKNAQKRVGPWRYDRPPLSEQQRQRMEDRRAGVRAMKIASLTGLTRAQINGGTFADNRVKRVLKVGKNWGEYKFASKAGNELAPFYYSNGAITGGPKPVALHDETNAFIPLEEDIGLRRLNKALATYHDPIQDPPTRKILYRIGAYQIVDSAE